MTQAEMRALLARCDPRKLREDQGISRGTVMRAIGADRSDLYCWESGLGLPLGPIGQRWIRVVAGLERHAAVSAEIAAMEGGAEGEAA
jgi:hypothetical protein